MTIIPVAFRSYLRHRCTKAQRHRAREYTGGVRSRAQRFRGGHSSLLDFINQKRSRLAGTGASVYVSHDVRSASPRLGSGTGAKRLVQAEPR